MTWSLTNGGRFSQSSVALQGNNIFGTICSSKNTICSPHAICPLHNPKLHPPLVSSPDICSFPAPQVSIGNQLNYTIGRLSYAGANGGDGALPLSVRDFFDSLFD